MTMSSTKTQFVERRNKKEKDIEKLEPVQKFALKMCNKNWASSYPESLKICSLPELIS